MSHREELLRHFRLAPEDLEANRVGRLSERQARYLVEDSQRRLLVSAVFGVALLGILYWISDQSFSPTQWVLPAAIGLGLVALSYVQYEGARRAVREKRVERFAGTVRVQMAGRAGWRLLIAGGSFNLPVRFRDFRDGAMYRAYVAPRANRVVALEPDGWE